MNKHTHRLAARGALALLASIAGCGGGKSSNGTPPADGGMSALYVVVSNVEKSAFIGTWDGARPGHYTNANAFEVGVYPFAYVSGRTVIVTQKDAADVILRFELGDDGALTPGGQLAVPAKSTPGAVRFASADKAYVTLAGAGKVWAFNPTTMTLIKEIDLNGPMFAPSKVGTDDQNSNPDVLGLRDGKLFVGLTQVKVSPITYPGVTVAVVDVATDTVDKVIQDRRGLAPATAAVDQIFPDETGDLYVYCGASYGYAPGQSHGFLRIKSGETDFDPTYLFDVSALALDVPGGKTDYFLHLAYAGGGVAYGTVDVPGAASSPPDYAKDHTMQPVMVDLYARTVTKLPVPMSNGYSGAVEIDGDTALFALAAVEGVGIFPFDLVTKSAVTAPAVTTDGYVSTLVRAR